MTGTLNGSLSLTGTGMEPARAMGAVRGQGQATITEGTVHGLQLVRPIVLAFGGPDAAQPVEGGERFSRLGRKARSALERLLGKKPPRDSTSQGAFARLARSGVAPMVRSTQLTSRTTRPQFTLGGSFAAVGANMSPGHEPGTVEAARRRWEARPR